MLRKIQAISRLLLFFTGAGMLCTGCLGGKDCTTGYAYYGTSVTEGTWTYSDRFGSPPETVALQGSAPDSSGTACMQVPATCSTLGFFAYCGATKMSGDLTVYVRLSNFQNAQLVTLPSPNVVVAGLLEGLYPYDGGVGDETLTPISGSLTATLSPNNLDVHFDMTLRGPGGEGAVIQNGRAASLNGHTTPVQNCD